MKNKRNFLIKASLKKKLKTKWFIGINIFLFIVILLLININTIINIFGGEYTETKVVKIIDELGIYDELKENILNAAKFSTNKFEIEESYDIEESKSLKNNEMLLVVSHDEENYIKGMLYTNYNISDYVKSMFISSLNRFRYDMALKDLNISSEDIKRLNMSITFEHKMLNVLETNEQANTSNDDTRLGVVAVVVFVMPFFFIITTLVQMVGSEINEEKSTKAMEVIISNVSPKDHLIAKTTACTLYTIVQVLLISLYFGIAIFIRNKTGASFETETNRLMNEILKSMISPEIVSSMLKILPLIIIFLIFTFVTYAIVAGVFASVTTNIDDFQQLQTPIMLTISIGFYLSILASIFEGARLIKVLSYFPLISFMLSPSLYMLKQVSLISVVISTIIQIIFTLLVVKYGFKIYKVGILNYSGDNLWKKIFKAIKE